MYFSVDQLDMMLALPRPSASSIGEKTIDLRNVQLVIPCMNTLIKASSNDEA